MNLKLGIVGLPNVGKSTLFNALTKQSVPAENYPFCTIDPNVGIVAVADKRLFDIAAIAKPARTTPAVIEFVDIAGLVKGAASGAGLGNKFLSHIKEVDAIVQVIRAFDNSNITHVENSINPTRDIELINTELILKDLETIANRQMGIGSKAKFDKVLGALSVHLEELSKHLESGKLGKDFPLPDDEDVMKERKGLFLITDKPVIFLVNATKDADMAPLKEILENQNYITMDIKTEYDLATMEEDDRKMFMTELGLEETGLESLTRAAYDLLGLISYFTEGPEEVRAWTIEKGWKAPMAGTAIHTDFLKKFIACDVCYFQDYLDNNGWNNCKTVGKVRLEGKDYVVKDGDIVVFRHGS